jgi:hypothetical protein
MWPRMRRVIPAAAIARMLALCVSILACAATRSAPEVQAQARDELTVLWLGHSLVNFHMPAMVRSIARSTGVRHEYVASIGVGAPLAWHWAHPERAEGADPVATLRERSFDVFVLTEGVPLASNIRWNDTIAVFGRFYDLAIARNPACQVYLYETWHSRSEPDWRARLDRDRALWASIADGVDAAHEGPDVLIVPAGRALGVLADRIAAGAVPGVTSLDAVFHDDIHLSDLGNYFVALVQFATIHRRSPVGASAATVDQFGGAFAPPPAAAVPVLQEIAWEVVRTDPRSGVRGPI